MRSFKLSLGKSKLLLTASTSRKFPAVPVSFADLAKILNLATVGATVY